MPPAPELRDGARNVGVIEVLLEMEPEHSSQADGHVGVPGKVEVNLHCVGNRPDPGCSCGLRGGEGEDAIRQKAHVVRDQYLLAESKDEPGHAFREVLAGLEPVLNLVSDRSEAHDWSRDKLRKQGQVQRHVEGVALNDGRGFADVKDVGHQLKCEEGNPDRQRYVQGEACPQDVVDVPQGEREVLEPEQQAKVVEYGDRQSVYLRSRAIVIFHDQEAEGPVDQNGGHHDEDEERLSPSVKKEAG